MRAPGFGLATPAATPAAATLAAPAIVAAVWAAAARPSVTYRSRASAIAAADSNRSAGSRAIARRAIASSAGGTDGFAASALGVGPLRRAVAIAAALSPG